MKCNENETELLIQRKK